MQETDPFDVEPASGYVLSKARTYCKIGRELYRKNDFFNYPDKDLPEDLLQSVDIGMAQLIDHRGMSEENPLSGIGIEGFYALLKALHFDFLSQALISETQEGYLDEMIMKHRITGMEITIYNLVARI